MGKRRYAAPVVTGHVDEVTAAFTAHAPGLFKHAFYIHRGHDVEFQVKRKYKRRSNKQNRYYRGYIVRPLAEFLGLEEDEMHDSLKAKHNSTVEIVNGEEFLVIHSTAEDDSQEAEDYYERIRRWAASFLNFYIPLPNEGVEPHLMEMGNPEPLALTNDNAKDNFDS